MFLPFPPTGGTALWISACLAEAPGAKAGRGIFYAQRRTRCRVHRKPELTIGAACLALFVSIFLVSARAQQPAVAIDNDDIGGVVTEPERAGSRRLGDRRNPRSAGRATSRSSSPTIAAVIVVPDLPKANYTVWVRGYGSWTGPKVTSAPGKRLNLTATPAPNERLPREYYPAIYWFSMLKIPAPSEFGGEERHPAGDHAERLAEPDEEQRLRRLPSARTEVDAHHSAGVRHVQRRREAWMRRMSRASRASMMIEPARRRSAHAPYKYLGDWTDRIAKGELPHTKPTRPQGVERNIVVTAAGLGDESNICTT